MIGDSLLEVAKKIAEDIANQGTFDQLFNELAKNGSVDEELIFRITDDGDVDGGKYNVSSDYQALIKQLNSSPKDDTFSATVYLSLGQKKSFVQRQDLAQDANEMYGVATLRILYNMNLKISDGGRSLQTKPKEISSTFEFKRVQQWPLVVRHFSFFGQNMLGSQGTEKAEEYLRGQYNLLNINGQGETSLSPYITLESSRYPVQLKGSSNPFEAEYGYILFGTGGDDDKQIYLNLAAGSGDASESFHLYRGEQGESDFYRLYTSDYKSVLEVDPDELKIHNKGKQSVDEVKSLQEYERIDPMNGLPFYYLARKDYGYAQEWEKHPEFGFKQGSNDKIRANNFHLFGSGPIEDSSLSVVFGNVYRRCLSLSGYKQVKGRKKGGSGSSRGDFEIQAGPIYYYPNFHALHAHKLYLDEEFGERAGGEKYGELGAYAPIEVWDSRLNWSFDSGQKSDPKLKGSWIFISGDALLGRLIPTINHLQDGSTENYEIFRSGIGIQDSESQPARLLRKIKDIADGSGRSQPDEIRWVSPLIQAIYESGDGVFAPDNDFPDLFEVDGNTLIWNQRVKDMSAYLREVLLMFFNSSARAHKQFLEDDNLQKLDSGNYVLNNSYHGKIIQMGAKKWKRILELLDGIEASKQKFYRYQPSSGDWKGTSRALKKNDWDSLWSRANPPVFYFTLPDPWQIYLNSEKTPENKIQDSNMDRELKKRYNMTKLQKTAWNEALAKKRESAEVSGGEVLFNQYFAKLMTDPAWPLPYNHSLRYAIKEFKNYYFRKEGDQEDYSSDDIMKEAFPEFRDAIGYYDARQNPYLLGFENKPLNNKIQKEIIKKYKAGPQSKKGYYFAKDIVGSRSLEELEFNFFNGRCMYSFADQGEFEKRFRPDSGNYSMGTVACVKGGLTLKAASFDRGGVIHVFGKATIEGDLNGGDGLVLVADTFAIGSGRLDKVSIIQRSDQAFTFQLDNLSGNLVTRGPITVSRKGVIKYDQSFKNDKYLVGFQSYIDSWRWKHESN